MHHTCYGSGEKFTPFSERNSVDTLLERIPLKNRFITENLFSDRAFRCHIDLANLKKFCRLTQIFFIFGNSKRNLTGFVFGYRFAYKLFFIRFYCTHVSMILISCINLSFDHLYQKTEQ